MPSIVVTRQQRFDTPYSDVRVAHELGEALRIAEAAPGGEMEAFVIGGGELYAAALPIANRLYLTRVLSRVDGDATFPTYDERPWRLQMAENHAADDSNDHAHIFEIYERAAS